MAQIQVRRDTAANWTSANTTLAPGEIGFETDTGRLKIGRASTNWTSLAYSDGVTGFNSRTGNVSLTANDVTSALDYMPLAPLGNVARSNSLLIANTTAYMRGDVYQSGGLQVYYGAAAGGASVEPDSFRAGAACGTRDLYFRTTGSTTSFGSSLLTNNAVASVQAGLSASYNACMSVTGGDSYPGLTARVQALNTKTAVGQITGNIAVSKFAVVSNLVSPEMTLATNGTHSQALLTVPDTLPVVYSANSILTQGYSDARYPLLSAPAGQRIFSQQDSEKKFAQLDMGIVHGSAVLSASSEFGFQVMPYDATGDQSALGVYATSTDFILDASNKTWSDSSLLTRIYADTRYSAANHTHGIANVTGLQTALDGKQASGSYVLTSDSRLTDARTPLAHNQTWSTITGTPTTLSGYGITDGYSSTNPAGYITSACLTYSNITGTAYSLPTANTTVLGGVKVDGTSVTISNGTISVSTSYAGLGSNSFTGSQNLQDNELVRAKIRDYSETISSPTISAGTLTLNLETSNIFTVSLNAAITTLTISNPPASGSGGSFTLIFTADGTARAVTWPASIKWAGGTAPTLTSTSGKLDSFAFFTSDGGTSWTGYIGGQNF